jgi:hypothetical protein
MAINIKLIKSITIFLLIFSLNIYAGYIIAKQEAYNEAHAYAKNVVTYYCGYEFIVKHRKEIETYDLNISDVRWGNINESI